MSTSRLSRSEPGSSVESFVLATVRGEVSGRYGRIEVDPELLRLTDPSSAVRTMHWGNNYLYQALLRSPAGDIPVVVKAFRNETALQRLRRRWRGSKAERSWRVSLALLDAGIQIPEPIALIDSTERGGPSFFITGHLDGALEARYLFRAMNAGREVELFPGIDVEAFLRALGRMLRQLHDRDFWHRDISAGNVLIVPAAGEVDAVGPGAVAPDSLYLVDLNRCRVGKSLTLSERMRDLCRLPVFRHRHQQQLLESYWSPGTVRGQWLFRLYHRSFLGKNKTKQALRGVRSRLERLMPKTRHVHIAAAAGGASARDRIVWDELSDQPHQHAGRLTRLRLRLEDAGSHLRAATTIVGSLAATMSHYRRLKSVVGDAAPPWPQPGISLAPGQHTLEQIEPLLRDLQTQRLLLRLRPWEEDLSEAAELATELHARGYELVFSVPQNRDLVRDPQRWRAALDQIAARFLSYGRLVQVGHAINRSKWGFWNTGEYETLMGLASEVLRGHDGVEILGPAVIDFEFHHTAMVLNSRSLPIDFDVITSLLYVDRRGAPENRQVGFDTIDKVNLHKAVVMASRHGDRPCWITEVNWPLAEGPHSPAGRRVTVDEQSQADYLVRYYIQVAATGVVERVYWWQLIARGYGLVNPIGDQLVRRPSYEAFRFMAGILAGSRLEARLPSPAAVRLYVFAWPEGRRLAVGWVNGELAVEVELGWEVRAVVGRDGATLPRPPGTAVTVTASPRYFELC